MEDTPLIPNAQDTVAKTIGSTLWKGYEELRNTVSTSSPALPGKKKYSPHQIPPSLDRFEEDLRKQKNDMGLH